MTICQYFIAAVPNLKPILLRNPNFYNIYKFFKIMLLLLDKYDQSDQTDNRKLSHTDDFI